MNLTLGQLLRRCADVNTDKALYAFPQSNVSLSYAGLLEQVHKWRFDLSLLILQAERLASGLLVLGLRRGDRIGIWGPNTPE